MVPARQGIEHALSRKVAHVRAGGHRLDETDVHRLPLHQLHEGGQGRALESGGRAEHHVDFDGGKAGRERGIEAAAGGDEVAAAGDGRVYVGIEGIEADVDAHEARVGESSRTPREHLSVSGECQVLETRDAAETGHDVFEISAQQWLAASEANSAQPELNRGRRDGDYVSGAERIARR